MRPLVLIMLGFVPGFGFGMLAERSVDKNVTVVAKTYTERYSNPYYDANSNPLRGD